ncbi:translocation/assembly module TamB domain-containing protein [Halanaerobacter jeridensis]|uniref:Translocation and assembly module TamB n=1 Tax=Halanaerobacter jeridensis TaxID=706427 RepID=A0A938XSH5_9FIRM|nr:translocation/assembly module TamB domain-containing protein [Halanaerobacter jeridensis]MBM7556994.1 translocation and assembly module TamB [Halanaerobacter jeridensis]
MQLKLLQSKKFIIGLSLLVLVLGGLYFNINQILNEMKGSIVSQLESRLNTEIKIERLRLSGFNQITADNVVLKDNNGRDLMRSEELTVSYSIIALVNDYSQPLKIIKDIEVNTPQINLIQKEKWNYNFLLSSAPQKKENNNSELFPIYINEAQVNLKTDELNEEINRINGVIDLRGGTGIFLDGEIKGLASKVKTKIIINEQDYQGQVDFSNLKLDNLSNKRNLNFPQNLDLAGTVNGKVKFKGEFSTQNSFYGDLFLENGSLDYQGLSLNRINGNFGLNEYGLKVKELSGYYQDNLVSLNGSIFGWQQPQLNLNYEVKDLQLTTIEKLLAQNIDVAGQADIKGQIEGTVAEPTIRSTVQMDRVNVAQETIKDITADLYYKGGVVNLEQLALDYKQGTINLDGTLDLNKSFNYIINTNFNDLSVADIELEFLSKLGLKGIVNGQAIISGEGLSKEKLNILGSLKVKSGAVKGYDFRKFSSKFWLNKQKLFLNNTELQGQTSHGTVNGFISLAGDVDLDLKLNQLSLKELQQFHQLEDLNGQIDLDGALSGTLSQPQLKAEVNGLGIEYQEISLGELKAELDLNKEEVHLNKVTIPKYASQLHGVINFADSYSRLIATTNNLQAEKIDSLIHEQLTLSGNLSATTKVTSLLSNPIVESDLKITEGTLLNKQNFDNLALDLSYDYQQQRLTLREGEMNYKDSSLELKGTMIGRELDFNFSSPALVWEDINFTDKLKELTGSAEVSGSVYGDLDNPKAAAKFSAQEVQFEQKTIGDLSGRIDYRKQNIYMTDIAVQTATNQYQLNGSFNPQTQEIDNVSIDITTGTTDYLKQFLAVETNVSYQFNGQIEVDGALQQPQFDVELLVEDNDDTGTLEVIGDYSWSKDADLQLIATKFDVSVLNNFEFFPYPIRGNLNLNGRVTGRLTAPNFTSELKITSGEIANLSYEKLAGSVEVVAGKKVILEQRLEGEGDNVIEANGQIPLIQNEDFDLELNLAEGNLRILSLLIPKIESAHGKGSANLKITGPLAKPTLSGSAKVVAGSFAYPTLDRKISNLNGEIKFANNQLLLKNISGYYGEGNFSGSGSITLDGLSAADYDLELNGQQIAFEHGSWQGMNDLDISITGTGLKPEITGVIKAYDTQFELPVDWPSAKGGVSKIKPQIDITVEPGSNVRVVNEQIDILVQRGTLNLRTIDGKVRLIGELNSNSGRFTYYNTEFELQEGRAIFRQYDYIPNLQLEATTEIYDRVIAEDENNLSDPYHDITLTLTGPADQLNYQLSSDSNLSQEKIIALLTGQGGIGNLLEKNYEQALTSELRRVIGQGIKTEVIYKVERSFEQSLDLDQVRIKSLLESNDSIEVEIGKYIFNNFMLKYNHSFLEESKAIGFEYYFNQGLDNLMIQGNYNSSGEYELGLEASIPFE